MFSNNALIWTGPDKGLLICGQTFLLKNLYELVKTYINCKMV